MISRLLLVLGAAAALLVGVTAPAQAGPGHTNLRHSCTLVGAPAAGVQGVTCADIWATTGYHPWAGSEALCQRVSDNTRVECSGAQQTIELWNATKDKLVKASAPASCGSFTNYTFRCQAGDRNYVDFASAQITGCDQAYVVARTTIRLPAPACTAPRRSGRRTTATPAAKSVSQPW
jgi:hypothetical protein